MKLSIIVPVHNEQDNITDVIEKIEAGVSIPHELVVVDDHSTDKTHELVSIIEKKYHNLRLVNNTLKGGFANAIRTGFTEAKGDVVVPVMGDLCDDLGTISVMFDKLNDGYDVVCGSRYMKGGRRLGGSKFKGFLSGLAGRSLHFCLGIPTGDIANAFKMYRKSVLENIDIKAQGFEISMEIPLKAYYAGYKLTDVPTVWKERVKGKSNFKIFKLLPSYLKLYLWAIYKRIRG